MPILNSLGATVKANNYKFKKKKKKKKSNRYVLHYSLKRKRTELEKVWLFPPGFTLVEIMGSIFFILWPFEVALAPDRNSIFSLWYGLK